MTGKINRNKFFQAGSRKGKEGLTGKPHVYSIMDPLISSVLEVSLHIEGNFNILTDDESSAFHRVV